MKFINIFITLLILTPSARIWGEGSIYYFLLMVTKRISSRGGKRWGGGKVLNSGAPVLRSAPASVSLSFLSLSFESLSVFFFFSSFPFPICFLAFFSDTLVFSVKRSFPLHVAYGWWVSLGPWEHLRLTWLLTSFSWSCNLSKFLSDLTVIILGIESPKRKCSSIWCC